MGRKDGDSRRKLELVQSSVFVGLKERVRLVIIRLQMREGDWMKNQGALCALFGGAIWGLSGTCGQFLFTNSALSPLALTWIRMLIAGIVLTLLSLVKDREKVEQIVTSKKDGIRCIIFAFAGLLVCQLSYLETIQYSNSATSTVFQYSGILFIMIVTCFLEKRTPYKKELFAVCLVLLGVFFVATHGNVSGLVISHNAFVWGVIGSVSMLLYSMLPGNLLNAYGAGNVVGWAMLLNGIVLTFVVQPWKLSISLNEMTAIVLVFMVLFGTIVAFTLYLTGVAKIGAMRASMIACVEPVVATVTSALWLGTHFTFMDLVGFLMIVFGVLLVNFKKQSQQLAS